MKHPHRPDPSPSACPRFGRRTLLRASVAGAVGGLLLPAGLRAEEAARSKDAPSDKERPAPGKTKEGYPGPFPGRVVEVHHPGGPARVVA